jgi:hypothetical protein
MYSLVKSAISHDERHYSLHRLDKEERAECMAKGLCFVCWKHRHHANHCPDKKKKILVRQEKIEEEEDEVENRCLAENF